MWAPKSDEPLDVSVGCLRAPLEHLSDKQFQHFIDVVRGGPPPPIPRAQSDLLIEETTVCVKRMKGLGVASCTQCSAASHLPNQFQSPHVGNVGVL
jgi:hypothetical protein